MHIANIGKAKTNLFTLISRAAAGEEIVIARAGKPVARLIAYQDEKPPNRTPGIWVGKVRMRRDFDRLPERIAAAFRGEC